MMAETHSSDAVNADVELVRVPVADMDHAQRFYIGALGAERLTLFDSPTAVQRRASVASPRKRRSPLIARLGLRARFELCFRESIMRAGQPRPTITLPVDGSELDAVRAHLVSAGVPVDGPRCRGQEGHAALYFIDPFGNRIAVVTTTYARSAPAGEPNWETLEYQWRG